MKIKQLKKMLKGIPDNFDIAIDNGKNELMPICPTDSHVCQIQFNDTKEKIFVFVLCPCSCEPEIETDLHPIFKNITDSIFPNNKTDL